MGSELFITLPSASNVDAVRRVSPLAADLLIRCGPFDVPAGVLASSPTLETEDSEAADALRQFLAEAHWPGVAPAVPGGWLLLGRDDHTIVLGRRRGAVGLGPVVTLTRDGTRFTASGSGGWRLALPDRNEQVERCVEGRAHGASVTVQWDTGQDPSGVADRVISRLVVEETAEAVNLLVISIPNPDQRDAGDGWRFGTGTSSSATLHLGAPLGRRALLDNSCVPADAVRLQPD
jgi:hypothetical protein